MYRHFISFRRRGTHRVEGAVNSLKNFNFPLPISQEVTSLHKLHTFDKFPRFLVMRRMVSSYDLKSNRAGEVKVSNLWKR